MLKKKLIRDLRRNWSQFFVIFMMVLLSVMVFAGVHAYMDGMRISAEQIYEKYKKNYLSSLEKHGKARDILVDGLKSIPYLKVFPSQANFIMCEVTGGKKSLELCAEILVEEDILIKDLSSKVGNGKQYIRIAVRDEADNARLIEALKRH